jgi:hypothetical protein
VKDKAMGNYSIIEVADEIRRLLSLRHASDSEYDRHLLAFRDKFPNLTTAERRHALRIAIDEEYMTQERAFETECNDLEAWLDTLTKKPEAVHELKAADDRTPLRRFLAKHEQQ